jgi:hypothetical protein
MLLLDDNIPLYCQRRVFSRTSFCSMLPVPDKSKLVGVKRENGSNLSKAMKFSRYVQYQYSPSQPVPPDFCQQLQDTNYLPQARVPCTLSIFSKKR